MLRVLPAEERIRQLIWQHLEFDSGASIPAGYGAFTLSGFPVEEYFNVHQQISEKETLSPIIGSEEPWIINHQFKGAGDAPGHAVLAALAGRNDTLWEKLAQLGERQADYLGIQCRFVGYDLLPQVLRDSVYTRLYIGAGLPEEVLLIRGDTVDLIPEKINELKSWQEKGLVGWRIQKNWLTRFNPQTINRLFKETLGFSGLLIAEVENREDLPAALDAGAHMFWTQGDAAGLYAALSETFREGGISTSELDLMSVRMLQIKEWLAQRRREHDLSDVHAEPYPQLASMSFGSSAPGEDSATTLLPAIRSNLEDQRWRWVNWKAHERALTLVNNPKSLLPLGELYRRSFRIIQISSRPEQAFEQTFSHYADAAYTWLKPGSDGALPALPKTGNLGKTFVVALAEVVDPVRDSAFVRQIQTLNRETDLILVYFGPPKGMAPFDNAFTILYAPELEKESASLSAQALFGGVHLSGRLPADANIWFGAGCGELMPGNRLKFGLPEETGIAPEKLVSIDAIIESAISEGVMPGGQITVVKDGIVVYSKAFGKLDFDEKSPENDLNNLYDVASITKVAATSLMAMDAYENARLVLNNPLSKYLSFPKTSPLKALTLKKVMTHQTGLQPNMPISPILLYRDSASTACDSFFCMQQSERYDIQMADQFFFSSRYWKEVWGKAYQLKPKKRTKYLYSDVNMILLQQVLEQGSGESVATWVDQHFYRSLGLRHTLFNPLRRFKADKIAPTEQDDIWRRQVIRGYVHDETAALMGGVGGHAGLFSTSEELAVIGQLFLNGGQYGGKHYLKSKTIEVFTQAKYGNHRGLCFDTAGSKGNFGRAESTPENAYGHTGFTGGSFWVDPDNHLVFVFLANRTFPDRHNRKLFRNKTRERVHEVVYNALHTFQPGIPEL